MQDDLIGRADGLSDDNRRLRTELDAAQARIGGQEQAVELLAPGFVQGRLKGQRVVVISTPDAPARLLDGLLPLLAQSGAEFGGAVRLSPALLDPASSQRIDDLVAQVAVPGAPLPQGEPVEQAVTQLAQVLVRPPDDTAAPATRRVLAAYRSEELLEVTNDVGAPGTLAVVLAGGPTSTSTPGPSAAPGSPAAVLTLAAALDARGRGVVVAGTDQAAASGGVVQLLRADAAASDRVSTVDAADTPTGRLAVLLALQEQATGGAGAYGTAAGADAPLPVPAAP